eukprot:scaffold9725_cov45-Attheya_sp.AAC.1
MNRLRVEGLLAAFPKLMGHNVKQHTFVETDSVRYVYQPLENGMYLLLITTKASNIVEDLGTLRLLAKVVPDVAGSLQEAAINDCAFELIFAFDEVLTAGGYKEEASIASIRTNLLMDSHEEKMHVMVEESKRAKAKEIMRSKAKGIKDQQMQQLKNSFMNGQMPTMGSGGGGGQPGGMQGFGGGGGQSGGMPGFDSYGDAGTGAPGAGGYDPYGYQKESAPEPEEPRVVKKGMKLGGGGGAAKKDSLMAAMAKEDNFFPMGGKKTDMGLGAKISAPSAAPSAPVTLVLEEKISVSMNREGSVESAEVKGTLSLTANTDLGSIALVSVNKQALASSGFTFQTHPKVNKPAYEKSGVLGLKKGGFPLNRPVGILRWSATGEEVAPITVNCWPEDEGSGSMNVNIEFELTRPDMTLNDVNILLPLGTTDPPSMESNDGQYKHDPRSGMLCWHFDVIDANNASGSMEFSIGGSNPDAFFPVQIQFSSQSLLCPVEVGSVQSSTDGSSIPNTLIKSVIPESYQCA